MWRTSCGERVLQGAEAHLFATALLSLLDEADVDHAWDCDLGLPCFDNLTYGQKVAVLSAVGNGLFREDVPAVPLTAVLEGGIAAVFEHLRNSVMDLLVEYAATGEKPEDFSESSSYLLLMLVEVACALPRNRGDRLIERYVNRLVHGIGDDGAGLSTEEVDLMSWVPPGDWAKRILREPVVDGIAIAMDGLKPRNGKEPAKAEEIVLQIQSLVEATRSQFPWDLPADIPQSVYLLACIKNQSPLPPEFWRSLVFSRTSDSPNAAANTPPSGGIT